MTPSPWLDAGRILRAHGVRGELRVAFATAPDAALLRRVPLQLQLRHGPAQPVRIVQIRSIFGDEALVRLEGCDDRDAAMQLHGARLQLRASDMPPAEAGSYYLYELRGATACDSVGTPLGTVREIYDNGGQDLLVIDTPAGERLLPRVPQFVRRFHRAEHTLEICVPPALWEDSPAAP